MAESLIFTGGTILTMTRELPAVEAVGIGADGRSLIYAPNPIAFGTDLVSYSATNAQGIAGSALVTVIVRARPLVHPPRADRAALGAGEEDDRRLTRAPAHSES